MKKKVMRCTSQQLSLTSTLENPTAILDVHSQWGSKTRRTTRTSTIHERNNAREAPHTCYHCVGDHWIRDFLGTRNNFPLAPHLPPLTQFNVDCGIEHLVHDSPFKPENKGYIKILPFSSLQSSFESKWLYNYKL